MMALCRISSQSSFIVGCGRRFDCCDGGHVERVCLLVVFSCKNSDLRVSLLIVNFESKSRLWFVNCPKRGRCLFVESESRERENISGTITALCKFSKQSGNLLSVNFRCNQRTCSLYISRPIRELFVCRFLRQTNPIVYFENNNSNSCK